MGKSLREALVEHMAALQAQGLAPETPSDGEEQLEAGPPASNYETERPRRPVKRGPAGRRGRSQLAARPATLKPSGETTRAGPTIEPRPPSIGRLLERRAQHRRQEQDERESIRQLLGSVRGHEVEDAAVTAFMRELGRETGALPPVDVVLEAMRHAASDQPEVVAEAVRRYYRRPSQGTNSNSPG